MAFGDTPTIASSAYLSRSATLDSFGPVPTNQVFAGFDAQQLTLHPDPRQTSVFNQVMTALPRTTQNKEEEVIRRIVKVYIADPNENVPLSECLLYKGEEKLTDATDQELFFEIDIKTILDTYNLKRVKWVDKKVKDRTENLEPVKIRELIMTVVTVAKFGN